MMSTRLLPLLGLLFLSSCKQGLGERCQVDSDCESDLYCELAGNTLVMGGSCRSRTAPTVIDMAQAPDLAMPDLSMPDLSGQDLAGVDGMDGG
jgi:hypothetical protein